MLFIGLEPGATYLHWLRETHTEKLQALYWLHGKLGIEPDSPWHRDLLLMADSRHLGELGTWNDAIGEEWLSSYGYEACQKSAVHLENCLETHKQVVRLARRLLRACFRQLDPNQQQYELMPIQLLDRFGCEGVKLSDYGGTTWLNICICQLLISRAYAGNPVPRPTASAN